MKKKVLGVFSSLLVVAMLVLPMSVAFAEKPITMTLTGTWYPVGGGSSKMFNAGKSGNVIWKMKDVGCVWMGDIEGAGVFHVQWLMKSPLPEIEGVFPGRFILEDVTTAGRSGDLTIGVLGLNVWIESGSGDLSSIRGRGTLTMVGMGYDYEFEIKINP